MKLRNKKTGQILDKICIHICSFDVDGNECKEIDTETRSIEKVLETWEDYEPVEPIIGDPKIRKVVRVWAEANDVESVVIVSSGTLRCRQKGIDIEFNGSPFYGWTSAIKTITELCGEEEE